MDLESKQRDQLIRDAQYRKGLSISWFNAINNAREIVGMIYENHPQQHPDQIKRDLTFWRDWLLDEHRKYYAEVIVNIGQNYDSKVSIAKLEDCKNLEELTSAWIKLSEDERRDGAIRECAKKLKASYDQA